MRDDREKLLDIAEAINKIEKYAGIEWDEFSADELVQTWVIHHLQIIGEACRSLSPAFKEKHPDLPWQQIIGMRNILVHQYFGVDPEVVWAAVKNDLPVLDREVKKILARGN